MASENEDKEEYNFQVQGVSIEELARIIKEAAGEDIRFYGFKVPNLTGILTIPFTRKGYRAESSSLGNIYMFDRGSWEDYRKYKEIQKSKKKTVSYSAGELGTGSELYSGQPLLVDAITIIVLALGYFLGLVLTWIIANIITKGAYKRRKEITYLTIEFDKKKDEQIKKAIEKIVRTVISEGGYVKPATKKTFAVKGELEEYNNQFMEAYTKYFNLGSVILIASFSFIGFLTLLKFGGQFVFNAQLMVIVNYIFMIVYLLSLIHI